MYEQILSKPGNTIPRFIPKRIPIYKRISFRIAAVLIPLFVLGTFVGLQVGSRDNTPPDTREYAQTPVDISPLIILEANDGDRLISLPDGSNIRLYEGSSLAYDATFSENRVVALQGDAFFTVAKANGKTFEVLYNDVTVRVLGTEFQLCGRDSTTEVTLCSGSVEVISSGYTVQLEPLQQFVSENNSREYTVIELSEEDIARFYKSRLQFRRTPLRTALEQTAQFFNVEIEIESLSYNEPVRLSFGITDNLEDVLYMLQLVTDNAFSYRIEEGKVTVQGR